MRERGCHSCLAPGKPQVPQAGLGRGLQWGLWKVTTDTRKPRHCGQLQDLKGASRAQAVPALRAQQYLGALERDEPSSTQRLLKEKGAPFPALLWPPSKTDPGANFSVTQNTLPTKGNQQRNLTCASSERSPKRGLLPGKSA